MRLLLRQFDGMIEKFPVSPRFLRFCVVGGSGVGVNLAVLRLGLWWLPAAGGEWRHRLAMALAIAVSIFTNFLLNDLWTWGDQDKGDRGAWLRRLGMFYLVSSAAATVQWGIGLLLFEGAFAQRPGLWIYLSQAIGIVLAMGINFTVNHLWTFRRP